MDVTFILKVEAGCFTKTFVTGPCKSENNSLNFHHSERPKILFFLNVLLTVRLSIILATDQLNAQILVL